MHVHSHFLNWDFTNNFPKLKWETTILRSILATARILSVETRNGKLAFLFKEGYLC